MAKKNKFIYGVIEDSLPATNGLPAGGGWIPFDNPVTNLTERVNTNVFLPSPPPAIDFNYDPLTTYDEDDVAVYAGSWWQSQQDDNLGILPGTAPVGDAPEDWWIQIPRSYNGAWWVAGVYVDEKLTVWSDHNGQSRIYRLVSGTRPYVSVNIVAEEVASDWIAVTEQDELITAIMEAVTQLNALYHSHCHFELDDSVDANIELQLQKHSLLQRFTVALQLESDGLTIKMPVGTIMADAGWNSGTRIWESPSGASAGLTLLVFDRVSSTEFMVRAITSAT